VELDTPYGVKVALPVSEFEKIRASAGKKPGFRGTLTKDREVLEYLYRGAEMSKSETI
jgi:hypothetical protein